MSETSKEEPEYFIDPNKPPYNNKFKDFADFEAKMKDMERANSVGNKIAVDESNSVQRHGSDGNEEYMSPVKMEEMLKNRAPK